jgi:hypothetical protein
MQKSGDGGADGAVVGGVEAEDEDELGAEETDGQVAVDGGAVAT